MCASKHADGVRAVPAPEGAPVTDVTACRFVLVSGPPGVGRSTFVQQYLSVRGSLPVRFFLVRFLHPSFQSTRPLKHTLIVLFLALQIAGSVTDNRVITVDLHAALSLESASLSLRIVRVARYSLLCLHCEGIC